MYAELLWELYLLFSHLQIKIHTVHWLFNIYIAN